MCPSILNYFAEVLQTVATAYLQGDASPLRKLALRSLSEVDSLEIFHMLAKALNLTPDEVRDSQIFAKCGTLKLMKYLAANYEISRDDAVNALYEALWRGSLVNASWLADQFQLTKQELFPGNDSSHIRCCRSLDLVKWLVEKYQITLDDFGTDPLQHITFSSNTGLVRWMASTYKFERNDAVMAFHTACDVGNLDIVKFHVEFYQLTADEIRRENRALKNCDNLFVREWLLKNYY